MALEPQVIHLVEQVAEVAASVKAIDIKALDVTGRLALADAFVLASGTSERQVMAIVDCIEQRSGEQGYKPRREGGGAARWVLLDYGLVVVHVFHADDREFYSLERLWKDCPVLNLTNQTEPALLAGVGD